MTFKNESGLRPVEFKVLIKPDGVEQKSEGGIIIPERHVDRQQMAQVKGTLVAKGGKAFHDWPEDEQAQLVPGARVYFDIYSGVKLIGADGEEYKLTEDKQVGSLIEREGAVPLHSIQGRSRKGLDAA